MERDTAWLVKTPDLTAMTERELEDYADDLWARLAGATGSAETDDAPRT